MLFTRQDLQKLLYVNEYKIDGKLIKLVENELYETSRWSLHYNLVFSYDGKFYETQYSCGATEKQSESPFEDADNEIECDEVVRVEVTKIEYRRIAEFGG